jgi:ABC-type sugar transport system substrate-binding protein
MNYQGVVWQEIFLERHYTNAAPRHSLLNQGKQLWQGLRNYILNSARTHGFKACAVTAPCTPTKESAIAYLQAATGYEFGALKDADPPKKTEAEREAIDAGIPVIVPIEDTADLKL